MIFAACFSVAIVYNALGRQDGAHPAPFMQASRGEPAPRTVLQRPARVSAVEQDDAGRLITGTADDRERRQLVRLIQEELAWHDVYDGEADGTDGPATRAAIAQYQERYGLDPTGEASDDLLYHMQFNRRIIEATRTELEVMPDEPDDQIVLVQTGLAELGYDPGPIDGVLGERTREAIRQFQRDRRLPENGVISEALFQELRKITGLSSLKAG